jgi:hypothetical protein
MRRNERGVIQDYLDDDSFRNLNTLKIKFDNCFELYNGDVLHYFKDMLTDALQFDCENKIDELVDDLDRMGSLVNDPLWEEEIRVRKEAIGFHKHKKKLLEMIIERLDEK